MSARSKWWMLSSIGEERAVSNIFPASLIYTIEGSKLEGSVPEGMSEM